MNEFWRMSSRKPWSIMVSILLTPSFSRIMTLSIPAGWSRTGERSKNSGQWFGLHSLQTWIPLNISGVLSREGLQSMKTPPMESMNCGKGFKWSGREYQLRSVRNWLKACLEGFRQGLKQKVVIPSTDNIQIPFSFQKWKNSFHGIAVLNWSYLYTL